jgi:hypothetical protein
MYHIRTVDKKEAFSPNLSLNFVVQFIFFLNMKIRPHNKFPQRNEQVQEPTRYGSIPNPDTSVEYLALATSRRLTHPVTARTPKIITYLLGLAYSSKFKVLKTPEVLSALGKKRKN